MVKGKPLKPKLIAYFVLSLLILDPRVGESSGRRMMNGESSIVAGPGEKTFTQAYPVRLKLPMPEKEFLALLGKLKLEYEVYRRRDKLIPSPFHRKLDVSAFEKCYQVYGRIDRQRQISEKYHAYIDRDSQLVYLENAFSYPEP